MNQRDLLLVPFPFSDQSGKKVRPVVVVSNDNFNEHSEDLIVLGITSNITNDKYTLLLNNKDLELVFEETVTSFEVPLYLYQNKKYFVLFAAPKILGLKLSLRLKNMLNNDRIFCLLQNLYFLKLNKDNRNKKAADCGALSGQKK